MDDLQAQISACRICDESGIKVRHPQSGMARGNGRLLMFIGIDPGNTELRSGIAFSGAGGKRLRSWLERVGLVTDEDVEKTCYFTSLAKCKIVKKSDYGRVFSNCWRYLQRQIAVVSPKIVCTLGAEPLSHLFSINAGMGDYVGKVYREPELVPSMLIPNFSAETRIIPLPHPSPLSRWTNILENQAKLEDALSIIRREMHDE